MNGCRSSATNRDLNVGARSNDKSLRSYLPRNPYYEEIFRGKKGISSTCSRLFPGNSVELRLSQMLQNIIALYLFDEKEFSSFLLYNMQPLSVTSNNLVAFYDYFFFFSFAFTKTLDTWLITREERSGIRRVLFLIQAIKPSPISDLTRSHPATDVF